jgi:hypothetical protein
LFSTLNSYVSHAFGLGWNSLPCSFLTPVNFLLPPLNRDWHGDCLSHYLFTGVKATYLLAVAFLEIIRFSSNGGILNGGTTMDTARSAFTCVFEYLKTPNLMPAVFQCLTAIVHRAFETAVSWMVGFSFTMFSSEFSCCKSFS